MEFSHRFRNVRFFAENTGKPGEKPLRQGEKQKKTKGTNCAAPLFFGKVNIYT